MVSIISMFTTTIAMSLLLMGIGFVGVTFLLYYFTKDNDKEK